MVGLGLEFESLASRTSTNCHVIAVFDSYAHEHVCIILVWGHMGEKSRQEEVGVMINSP